MKIWKFKTKRDTWYFFVMAMTEEIAWIELSTTLGFSVKTLKENYENPIDLTQLSSNVFSIYM